MIGGRWVDDGRIRPRRPGLAAVLLGALLHCGPEPYECEFGYITHLGDVWNTTTCVQPPPWIEPPSLLQPPDPPPLENAGDLVARAPR